MDAMQVRETCDRSSCTYPDCTCFPDKATGAVENTSGLAPLGRAVLVRYYEPERQNSRIVVPDNVQDRVNQVEQRAQVIQVGPACWPDEPARASSGDFVLISKMAGYQCRGPKDGKPYRLVNDRDIFARLTHLGEPA